MSWSLGRAVTSVNATTILTQESQNKNALSVFMTVKLAGNFIASNQIGAFPRVSNKNNKYICVFYIYNPNFIKGAALNSINRSELLGTCTKVYTWCKFRGFKPRLHRMDHDTLRNAEDFIHSQNTGL
jgi:hypothetical protein